MTHEFECRHNRKRENIARATVDSDVQQFQHGLKWPPVKRLAGGLATPLSRPCRSLAALEVELQHMLMLVLQLAYYSSVSLLTACMLM
jgi:hypothetical protein